MMIQKRILIIFLILGILPFFIPNSYGHGIGNEVLPPVLLGNKLVSLEVTSSQLEDPDNPDREISLSLFDIETGITIKDVTYNIEAVKANQILFDSTFTANDGIIVMDFLHSDSEEIELTQKNKESFFDSLIGGNKEVIEITGKPFNTGGLYIFKVQITTAESYTNELEEPIRFDVGLSVPQRNFYEVNDPNFGKQQLSVVTYYDEIEKFRYDPKTKIVSFSMPFEGTLENIIQVSVVHEELTLSKTFGDLMVSSFTVSVNGYEIPERAITIDGFSEVQRIVHIVLNQNDLIEMLNAQQGFNNMKFQIKPSEENLPLKTVTGNGQFKIDLDWEPKQIKSGSNVKFSFDILDVFFKDKPISVPYDLSLMHQGKVLFSQSGISIESRDESDIVEFFVPENIQGIITVQFDNLDGNSLARVGLPVVVDRIGTIMIVIPDWVRNNASWWSDNQISDNDFASGIEFMIKEKIIKVPQPNSQSSENSVIPDWVRNNAKWWSERMISDEEFANGLQYLIKNGIISV